jgi:uncharacterized delta-60 repeat protein
VRRGGGTGTVLTTLAGGDQFNTFNAVGMDLNGRIAAAGRVSSDYLVARFNADGSPDTSFSDAGFVRTHFGPAEGINEADSLVVLPDGRIVTAGAVYASGGSEVILARFNPDGSLDASFPAGGPVTAQSPYNGVRMTGQADGKFLVSGSDLRRYNADGSLDSSFGTGGQIAILGSSLTLAPDGKIVAAYFDSGSMHIARYNLDGSPDMSFGTGGQVLSDVEGTDLLAQPDGTVVAVGRANGSQLALERLVNWGIRVTPTSGLVTTETGGTAQFQVVLDSVPAANVTIPLQSSAPTEGTLSVASLTFTPQNAMIPQTVTVTGVADTVLGPPVAYTIITGRAVSSDPHYSNLDVPDVQVTNFDRPGLLVTPTSGLVTTESGGTASFTVGLTTIPTANVLISLVCSDTTEGSVQGAGYLVFTPQDALVLQTVTVAGVDDPFTDGNIPYTVAVDPRYSSAAEYSVLAPVTVSLINLDNEVGEPTQMKFSAASYSVAENGGSATITVIRDGGATGAASIDYATSDGTASANLDYQPVSGQLTWADGEGGGKSFAIPVYNDALVEGDETVNLILSNPSHGALLGSPSSAILTIVDTTKPGQLQFSAATYSVGESDGFTTVTVTRTGGSDDWVSVNYATSDGTALASKDYVPTSGTLWFNPGDLSKSVTIPVLNDGLVDGNETVNLTLSSPGGGATLGSPATAVLTIVDAAKPGQFQFSVPAFSVDETAGYATFTVLRTGGSDGTATSDYATSDGSARAGQDYLATSGTLTFLSGQTQQMFTVPVLEDGLVEGDETVNLTLSHPTGGATLGSPATAVLTIIDTDTVSQSDAAAWAVHAYHDVLNRSPTSGELSSLESILGPPANLAAAASALAHSAEHYQQFVAAAYARYLGRPASPAEVAGWVQVMQQGLSDEQLEAAFIGAPEYIANHGGQGAGWVTGMYQDLLGRTPAQSEVDGWVYALNQGMPPQQVAYGFAASAEREASRINGDYLALLGRPASPAEVQGWLAAFQAGFSNEDVVAGFAGSPEYFRQATR